MKEDGPRPERISDNGPAYITASRDRNARRQHAPSQFDDDSGLCDQNSRLRKSSCNSETEGKMTGRGGGGGRKVLLPPINFIFKLLQSHATVKIWLYEQLAIRIEGKIRGFDEFMNLVVDDAVEVKPITKTNPEEKRRHLGQILVKGDNVTLIQEAI